VTSTTLWSSLAGGFAGTLVMTTLLRGASELGITRMDLPFLLGTTVTDHRGRAKVVGYLFQFGLGLLFALFYGAIFAALGRRGWALGTIFGAAHAAFMGTVLVNILLPIVHPRLGTPETAAHQIALIEPPGFLLLNYGRSTFVVTLAAHMLYGAIVGWAVRL
jgi:hypothetical protein